MSRLIPEKRLDRNGRLVTKYVRDEPGQRSGKSPIPPASLGGPAVSSPVQGLKKFKPRPKQLEQRPFAVRLTRVEKASRKLWVEGNRALDWRLDITHRRPLSFEASEVEAYSVFSAMKRPVDSLHLLALGIRDAASAREFASARGAEELLNDRAQLTDEALRQGVPFEDFFGYHALFEREDRDPADVVAAIRFSVTRLSDSSFMQMGVHGTVAEDIADGKISYEDIKAVGVSHLRDLDTLRAMRPVLDAIRTGKGGWTPKGLREVLDRPRSEGMKWWSDYGKLGELMSHSPMAAVLEAPRIENLILSYAFLTSGRELSAKEPSRAASLVGYASSIGALRAYGPPSIPWGEVERLHTAGVSEDIARGVLAAGGTPEQAMAVAAGDVESGLATGFL